MMYKLDPLCELLRRKKNRLTGYDYSRSGVYFITFCVKEKHEMLGKVVGGATYVNGTIVGDAAHSVLHATALKPYVHLSEYGIIVKDIIDKTPECYDKILLDNYVIMPNHIHLLIRIVDSARDAVGSGPLQRHNS